MPDTGQTSRPKSENRRLILTPGRQAIPGLSPPAAPSPSLEDSDRAKASGFAALRWIPSLSGFCILVAVCFFGASLTPSLVPRDPMAQAVLGGVLALVGYGLARAFLALWRFMELPEPPASGQSVMRFGFLIVSTLVALFCLAHAAEWQNATRAVMELEPVDTASPVSVALFGALVFLVLWAVCHLIALAFRMVDRVLRRLVPRRVGFVLGAVIVGWAFWAAVDGVLIRSFFEGADASFEAADSLIEPTVAQPAEPLKTGSSSSLVRWEEMGRWGRFFVSRAPTRSEIAAFAGPEAMDPIRIYVGRRSAATARERADLALRELIRVGGFQRSNLVVLVPVGTGWMDPGSHDTLDFILGGDVATVAVQYSYLTSGLALLAHPDYGLDQAGALFDAIYGHWTTLPRETRPKLFVHGLSQGAYNSQATFPLLDILGDPIDGALWAGSPFLSQVWQQVRASRQPGSPAWKPVFGNGSLVRVVNQNGNFEPAEAPWGPIRVVFLTYGSDPIVEFTFDSAFRKPDWLKEPRAPDVPTELRWFPIVTMGQIALDMLVSLQVPGYGHYYIARDYIDAWAEVVDPPGWSAERASTLKAIFDQRPPAF
ncbi:MAG: alpha/beta-hydrolase family protein [Pseudomonadota bacterium]